MMFGCMTWFNHNKIRIRGQRPQKKIRLNPRMHDCKVLVKGYDNEVCIDSDSWRGEIHVCGVGNKLIIEEGVWVCKPGWIEIGSVGSPAFHCTVVIGRNTYLGEVNILCVDDGSRITIGKDCMFSQGIKVWCTDGHAIQREDGSLNMGKEIHIGERVWVGLDCKIGKNTRIGSGCMVGWGSVVTGTFDESNCLIAGVPAKVRRQGIMWHAPVPSSFLEAPLLKQYEDWNEESFPCLPLRLWLRMKLPYFRFLACHKHDRQKRQKYERKAQEIIRRLRLAPPAGASKVPH